MRSALLVATAACASAMMLVGCGKKSKAKPTTEDTTTSAEAVAASANAVPGVTAEEIKFGMTGPFTGFNAGYSTETWRGLQAYFMEINAQGGVHGRKITIEGVDDAYNADKQIENLAAFAQKRNIFVTHTVGTAHFTKGLNDIVKYQKEQDFLIWAPYSGAQVTRKPPAVQAAFNIRPSYYAESAALVDAMIAAGKKKIGAFISDDAFGRDGLAGITTALAARGMQLIAETKHPTGHKFDESTMEQVNALRAAGVDAVICSTNYQPGAAFVRDARTTGWNVPIGQNSHAGDTYLRRLNQYEADTGKKVSYRLVSTATVPRPDDVNVPVVAEYRELMTKRNPRPPQEILDPNYRINEFGQTSLEGFISGKVFVEVLRRVGPNLTRKRFIEAAETIRDFDPGTGQSISYSSEEHQGFDKAWASIIKDGKWAPLPLDMKAFAEAPIPAPDPKAIAAAKAAPIAKK